MKKPVKIGIPEDLEFADLQLRRDPDGAVSYEKNVIARICEASGIDPAQVIEIEDNAAGLMVAWYAHHRAAGGAQDPVAEDLITEVVLEEAAGQSFSLPPGDIQ